jgi:hypothetical protein
MAGCCCTIKECLEAKEQVLFTALSLLHSMLPLSTVLPLMK